MDKTLKSAYISFYMYYVVVLLFFMATFVFSIINKEYLNFVSEWNYNMLITMLMGITITVFSGNLLGKKNQVYEKEKEIKKPALKSKKIIIVIMWCVMVIVSGVLFFRISILAIEFNFNFLKVIIDFGYILSAFAGVKFLQQTALHSKPFIENQGV